MCCGWKKLLTWVLHENYGGAMFAQHRYVFEGLTDGVYSTDTSRSFKLLAPSSYNNRPAAAALVPLSLGPLECGLPHRHYRTQVEQNILSSGTSQQVQSLRASTVHVLLHGCHNKNDAKEHAAARRRVTPSPPRKTMVRGLLYPPNTSRHCRHHCCYQCCDDGKVGCISCSDTTFDDDAWFADAARGCQQQK